MVAIAGQQPEEKRIRITLTEARVLAAAVAMSCIHNPMPECCATVLTGVMDRICEAFDIDVDVDLQAGTLEIDGILAAREIG